MRTFLQLFALPAFRLVNLANLLEGICYFGMVPLLIPFVQQHFQLDDVQAAWVTLYYTGMVTLLMFPGGAVCDRLGSRRSLGLALALTGAGRCLLCLSPDWGLPVAVLGLTVMSAGTGLFQPSVYTAVKEYTPTEQAAPGYSWLYSIMNLGSVLWFLLSPKVRAWGQIEGVFLVLTAATMVNLCFQLAFFRQDPYRRVLQPDSQGQRWNSRFLVFIWLLVPVRSLVAHLTYTLPTAIMRTYPWVADRLEYSFALNNLLLFVGTPLLTYLTLGRDLLSLMIGGSLASALSLSFLMLPPETHWLVLFLVVFSLGEAVWQSRFFEFVAHQAPAGKVGAAMSFANFPWFVAKTAAGSYSGWMLLHYIPKNGPQHPEILWGTYLLGALLTPVSLFALRAWLAQGLAGTQTEQQAP
ncbi:MFS transporter [bacterium]|nr:MFS transporter [bacterium]